MNHYVELRVRVNDLACGRLGISAHGLFLSFSWASSNRSALCLAIPKQRRILNAHADVAGGRCAGAAPALRTDGVLP